MEQLRPGSRFLSYRLDRCIGKGAFGAVWAGQQEGTGQLVAIKFEFPNVTQSKSLLPAESEIYSECSSSEFFPRFFGSGTSQGLTYCVLEQLGLSLRAFQENHPSGILSHTETCLVGVAMLRAIQDFHERGFVHRDIKPANFVFRDQREHKICLIDFGLAQRWRSADGEPIPPRPNVGFRGTARYASLNSHAGNDLGRRDDLWSLFFLLIEFAAPPLQWRSQRDKQAVAQLKRVNLNRMCTGLPEQFSQFLAHLMALQFEDQPDYDMLAGLLASVCEGGDGDADWGACMSETYGSMALIVAPNSGSVIGSSSEVEGSWAAMAPRAQEAKADDTGSTDGKQTEASAKEKGGGCCLLM
jgi:tau tubulin kinase